MSYVNHLLDFLNASPTPYHAVWQVKELLLQHQFIELFEKDSWQLQAEGAYFVIRDGALIAFKLGQKPAHESGLRVLGAHTDSPGFRLKPNTEVFKEGYSQLAVEVYGSPLWYSWLDRDLGLAGLVMAKTSQGLKEQLVYLNQPILRIPSVAIHLLREVNQEGFKLNAQQHLQPILSLSKTSLATLLTEHVQGEIIAWDLLLFDIVKSTLGGFHHEFIFSARLDNLAMCHASIQALLHTKPNAKTQMVCLYDHEEVGSASYAGAEGSFAEAVLKRICETEGPHAKYGSLSRALAQSYQLSADMAHAVHPNYPEKHEPLHLPKLNEGPVIKVNAQQRYATEAKGAAFVVNMCKDLGIPYQKFVSRNDLGCGSTIGPLSATRLGIKTIDVGNPMLSMHSVREQAGAFDHEKMIQLMREFLAR